MTRLAAGRGDKRLSRKYGCFRTAIVYALLLSVSCAWLPGFADTQLPATGPAHTPSAYASQQPSTAGSSTTAQNQVALDLSSQTRSVKFAPDSVPTGALAARINVGGTPTVFQTGDLLTAAEYAAVLQVVGTGKQSLILDSIGRAAGGSIVLNSVIGNPGVNTALASLLIPSGVTAIQDFGTSKILNVAGNVTNSGTLYAVTSNPQVTTATISSLNLFNQPGSLLTSILPPSGLPGFSSALSNLNLSVTVQNNLVNFGTISSSGNLNITASNFSNFGTLTSAGNTNIAVANQFQNFATAQLVAGNSLYVNAASIVNTGLLSALGSLLALNNSAGGAFSISNIGGLIQAKSGTILIGSTSGLDLTGGILEANALKFSAPTSSVSVNVEQLDGPVFVQACTAGVNVSSGDLRLEEVDVSGDPIFTNSSTNDLTLPASIQSGPVTAVAAGNIFGNSSTGTTIDTTTTGGDVILLAGVANQTVNGVTTVTGPSGSTGSISGINSINTSGSPAGNITLGAFGGSITVKGGLTAQTQARIRLFAPAGVTVGDITANQADPSVNQVDIATANPVIGQGLTFDSSGKLTAGSITASSQIGPGSVTTGNLFTGHYDNSGGYGGSINIIAGGSIATGWMRTLGAGAMGGGGNYAFPGGNAGNVNLSALAGQIVVNGDINTTGGAGGGSNYYAGGPGGAGGNVTLSAKANVTVNGPILTAGGGGGGGVGICSCDTAGGGGSLGNSAGPTSGGLFVTWPPYNGVVNLDAGPTYGNPNHPPVPFPGQGGSNSAYDVGCCGGGRGGDVGQFGAHGGTGTFQRGWWDDRSTGPGGAPGPSGNITISGRDISITQTLGTAFATWNNAGYSPYAPFSVFAFSQSGGGAISITSTGFRTATSTYDANGSLGSTAPTINAQLRAGQLNVAGMMAGNSISFNNSPVASTLSPGVYQLQSGSGQLTIIENNQSKIISSGQRVTPAEWIALVQIGSTQTQPLILGQGGYASGGSLDFASENLPAGGFSILTIPQSVIGNAMAGSIQVNGAATVSGSLKFPSSGSITALSLTLGDSASLMSTSTNGALTINSPALTLGSNSIISSGGDLRVYSGSPTTPLAVTVPAGSASILTQSGAISILAASQSLSFLAAPGAGSSTLSLNGGPVLLQVNGATLNVGSAVTLAAKNSVTVEVNNGQFTSNGTISSSTAGGGAGAITISSTGSLQINNFGALFVDPPSLSGGDGGSITVSAPVGTLTVPGATLTANAVGSDAHKGGQITVIASALSVGGSSPLILQANAAGGGAGGTVTVTTTGSGSPLAIGNGIANGSNSGQIEVFASGGTSGSGAGDGGALVISAGGDLAVDPTYITVAPLGAAGKGATIRLSAGMTGAGNLTVSGGLDASGVGAGDGGAILLASNSTQTFLIGGPGINSLAGIVRANGGTQGGSGGSVTVRNDGVGGVTLPDAANLSTAASAPGGNGGSLTLSAPQGILTLPAGTYSNNGLGSSGSGGRIVLLASQLIMSNQPPGPGNGVGLVLSASGSGGGAGGLVSVTVTGSGQDLSTGTGNGQVLAYATGGSGGASGSLTGDGGSLVLSAGHNLTVDLLQINAKPTGQNGRGAKLTFVAGSAGSGDLLVLGSLDASGTGVGSGGNICLKTNSQGTFTLNGGATNQGVTGGVTANAGNAGGDGGSFAATNSGSGGIMLADFTNVSISASSAGGAGGELSLMATGGALMTPSGSFSVDAIVGLPGSNGGKIKLTGMSINLSGNGGLTLTANAAGSGNGGSISVIASGPTSDLGVGIGTSPLALYVRGGSVNSSAGDGGSILVSAGHNLSVDIGSFAAGPKGTNGKGAQISFAAGTASSGNLFVNGGISINGTGNGNGGSASLSTNGSVPFGINAGLTVNGISGTLSANAGPSSGDGGSLSVANQGSGGILSPGANGLSVTASHGGGNGGKIALLAPQGPISIAGGSLSADAQGTSTAALNGGNIQLAASTLTVLGQAALALSANAASPSGNGGTIIVSVLAPAADLAIANTAAGLTISATGGIAQGTSAGNGGIVSVSAGHNLTVQSIALTVQPQGASGAGGILSLLSGQGGAGDLAVTGDLNLPGVGGGSGGNLTLSANGQVQVTGSISVAGGNSSSTASAGSGGIAKITSNGWDWVNGNIFASGGTNAGAGAGGAGGSVTLSTTNNNSLHYYVGSVGVGGIIEMKGGAATGGGAGGSGGTFSVRASTFRVLGGQSGFSINASADGSAPLSGGGSISISTYGTQPVPLNFDLISTNRSEFALPGGLFSVGDSTVNGTAGSIAGVGGSATPSNAARIVGGSSSFVQGNITISASLSSASVSTSGVTLAITSDNGSGIRNKVTPGQALALYQVSRGIPQTILLTTQDGQVIDGSTIDISQCDFYGPLSNFNIRTVNSQANRVTVNVVGLGPNLLLSASNSIYIAGTLNFTTPGSFTRLELGVRSLIVDTTGVISAPQTSQVTVHGTQGNWSINGALRSGAVIFDVAGGPLSISMQANGIVGGPANGSGLVTVNADTFNLSGGKIVNATLQFVSKLMPSSVNLNTTFGPGGYLGNVSAKQVHVSSSTSIPIIDGATLTSTGMILFDGAGALTGGTAGNSAGGITILAGTGIVVNNLQIAFLGSGNSLTTTAGDIRLQAGAGLSLGTTTTLGATASVQLIASNGQLTIGCGSIISSGNNLQISANGNASGITFGSGVQISAGKLAAGAPNSGPLTSSNIGIGQQGSMNIQVSGTGGLTIGSGSSFISNGGDIQINSSGSGSIIAVPDSSTIAANGGSLNIQAQSQITFGAFDTVTARSLNGSSGQINFNAGQGFSVGSGTAITAIGQMQVNAQSGAILFTGATGVSMTSGQGMNLNSSTFTTNANAVVTSGQQMQVNAGNGITIAAGTQMTAKQSMQLQTQKDLKIGDNAVVSAGSSSLQLSVSGSTSTLSIGSNAQLSAGALAAGAPSNGPLVSSNIAQQGTVNIQASGSGGITIEAGAKLTSNGSDVMMNSNGNVIISGTALLAANGGRVIVGAPGQVTFGSALARTLNGGGGQITVSGPQGLTVADSSNISAGTTLLLTTSGGSSRLNIGSGASLTSGSLTLSAPSTGTLLPAHLAQSGGITLTANGSGGINIQSSASLTTNGADLTITATGGSIFIGNSAQFKSNGGSLFILSQKSIDGAAGGASFTARAIGSVASSTGGAIELGSGLTSPQISNSFNKPRNTNPALGTFDSGVIINNSNGVLSANGHAANIHLNPGPGTASTLTLNHGFIQLDALGAGSSVIINQGTFQTDAYQPISFKAPAGADTEFLLDDNEAEASDGLLHFFAEPGVHFTPTASGHFLFRHGNLFVEAAEVMIITTELGEIHVKKGALVQMDSQAGRICVRAFSRPGDLLVVAGNRKVVLNPGQEFLLTDHNPGRQEVSPNDAIGRRRSDSYRLSDRLQATISDFSLVTAINSSSYLSRLRQSTLRSDRKLLKRLIHVAAVVDVVTRAKGPYKANAKPKAPTSEHGFAAVYESGGNAARPAVKYKDERRLTSSLLSVRHALSWLRPESARRLCLLRL